MMDEYVRAFMSKTDDVREFHETMRVPIGEESHNLKISRKVFRFRIMLEELKEYIDSNNMADELDALVDLVYTAIGTAVESGYPFDEAWKAVHEANMKKLPNASGKTNKIRKPEGWIAPNIEKVINESLDKLK